MTIIGINFVRDNWPNSFPKLFIGHYARLTFIHEVSIYSFPSEFDSQVTLLLERIPITLFSSFIALIFMIALLRSLFMKGV